MHNSIDKTFKLLRHSKNETAGDALVSALKSSTPEIVQQAAVSLAVRRSSVGHHELLRRWDTLADSLLEPVRQRPGRLPTTLRSIVLNAEHELTERACEVGIAIHDYDLIPPLAHACEDEADPHRELKLETMLKLATQLQTELSAPRNYENKRDPQLIRNHVVAALETCVDRFERHECLAMIEAFLTLTKKDNSKLTQIINNPLHPAYAAARETFQTSDRVGVIRLAVSLIEILPVPKLIVETLAEREDAAFLARFAKVIPDFGPSTVKGLRRIRKLGLTRKPESLLDLKGTEQAGVVGLLGVLGLPDEDTFQVFQLMLRQGEVPARREAASQLRRFGGADANQLIVEALDDDDAEVQTIAVRQIRERGIPEALTLLIAKTESQSAIVREAAQEGLGEFHFDRFAMVFDGLSDKMKATTGRLVRRADPNAIPKLVAEIQSGSRMKRIRGLQLAIAIEAVDDVVDDVITRLRDDNNIVRAEAAKALAYCGDSKAKLALRDALLDRSPAVQHAAETALYALTQIPNATEEPIA